MKSYSQIAATNQSTVVAEYTPEKRNSTSYQSEAELEAHFIKMLENLGYEYINITDEKNLIQNLRVQIEGLNDYKFSDSEWGEFFKNNIAGSNENHIDKTHRIQMDYIQNLKRDNGQTINIKLIDTKNIHNNKLQVINQYKEEVSKHKARYDVTILVNGLPLVHIELKRRGVSIREAFNQIERYKRDNFGASSGLFEYIQIFVISNGTNTKYYSNTTRHSQIIEMQNKNEASKKTSNSFEFTSFWADANNNKIPDLVDFTKTFFAKHTILSVLTKYCVLTSENLLLVMRPYQIAASERILNRIEIAKNYKRFGSAESGGYIWHTTGSGKTLTSFKTAQLAREIEGIDKVLFVVDRKDLDYQTMKEYDRFEKGAANSNTSATILQKQLEDDNCKIIITTIQKLSVFIAKNKAHEAFGKHIVIIFDECHRSQFGEMHAAIVKSFKKYYLFGFTGTPIFAANAGSGGKAVLKTTPQVFGGEPDEEGKPTQPLHAYTIIDAINDRNVLPFRVEYINTIKSKENTIDTKVRDIDTKEALKNQQRISNIVAYILEHFNQKTKRDDKSYSFNKLQNIKEIAKAKNKNTIEEKKDKIMMKGFNSIFAVESIDFAKEYYAEFKKQMLQKPNKALKIAIIYSFGVNEGYQDLLDEENSEDTSGLDKSSRDFLEMAICDYNAAFKTNYDTSAEKFQNYYKDVSLRMKNREIDLLIVVNMFLTGFDATTLNTLWVDKNLKYHGLLQAFSRTNRILNSIKTFGNIVCFRNLDAETEEALALFGNKNASGIVLLKSFGEYYEEYENLIQTLPEIYPLGEPIAGEEDKKEFIRLFGKILRLRNILSVFDEFVGDELISDRDLQDYQGVYVDMYQEGKKSDNAEKESIINDVEFEMELIKQIEVNIDYIIALVVKYHESNCKDKEIVSDINRAITSSQQLRSKRELIDGFIEKINASTGDIYDEWMQYATQQKELELEKIIQDERLDSDGAKRFINNCFRDGFVKTTGTDLDSIMPAMSLFGDKGKERAQKKQGLIDRFLAFFEKYSDI